MMKMGWRVQSASVADEEKISIDGTADTSLRDDELVLSTEQDYDISRDAHFGIPTSAVVYPEKNITS